MKQPLASADPLATAFRLCRLKEGLSQIEHAHRAKVSRFRLFQFERGYLPQLREDELTRLIDVFDMPVLRELAAERVAAATEAAP